MITRKILRSAALATGILAATVAAVASAAPGDPGRGSSIGPDEAIAVVRAATRSDEALAVTGSTDSPTSRGYVVSGPRTDAIVDVATGELGLLSFADLAPTSTAVSLTASDAVASAQSYADLVRINLPKVEPTVSLADHGSTVEYVVVWARRVNDVVVPDQLVMKVNATTGAVFSLVRVDRPFVDPSPAKVTRADAIRAADASLGDAKRKVLDADLTVVFDPSGVQRSVWRVSYRVEDGAGSYFGSLVLVDASTGATVPVE